MITIHDNIRETKVVKINLKLFIEKVYTAIISDNKDDLVELNEEFDYFISLERDEMKDKVFEYILNNQYVVDNDKLFEFFNNFC